MTTLQEVIDEINELTGKDAAEGSKLADLVDDSLEFTNLILAVESKFKDVPDALIPHLETVHDLWVAVQ
jgi:acyl carrier protein